MRNPLPLPLAIGVAAVALAVPGCGGDDDGETSSGERSEPAAEAPEDQTGDQTTADPIVRWPAPPDPMRRTVSSGLKPEPKEYLINHVHSHLDVFINGKPIEVPAGIGINIGDPKVQRFNEPDGSTSYGGITRCSQPCISPLHTHDATGILHTESKTPEPNRLGQFFTEWGVRLSDSCVGQYCEPQQVAFYVDGKRYTQDPRDILLTDQKEIAVVIGRPPAQIPETADFSNA